MLKAQVNDFKDREIGYIDYCSAERCDKWQAESFRDNDSERILRYCDSCDSSYCDGHMESDVLCLYCSEALKIKNNI